MEVEWPAFVKLLRSQMGFTQAQLSVVLGVSQRSVSRWERGDDRPNLLMQHRLRDLRLRPSDPVMRSLRVAIAHCPAPRALSRVIDLRLEAVSPAAIAKRPSIVEFIGMSLRPLATGILSEILDDRALGRGIARQEVAAVIATTRGVLQTPTTMPLATFRTTISYLALDGEIYGDAISAPCGDDEPLGYRAVTFEEMDLSNFTVARAAATEQRLPRRVRLSGRLGNDAS